MCFRCRTIETTDQLARVSRSESWSSSWRDCTVGIYINHFFILYYPSNLTALKLQPRWVRVLRRERRPCLPTGQSGNRVSLSHDNYI